MYKPSYGLTTGIDSTYKILNYNLTFNPYLLFSDSCNLSFKTLKSSTDYLNFNVSGKFNLWFYMSSGYADTSVNVYVLLTNLDTSESWIITANNSIQHWIIIKNLIKGNYKISYYNNYSLSFRMYNIFLESLTLKNNSLLYKDNNYYNLDKNNYDFNIHNYNKLTVPESDMISFYDINHIKDDYSELFTAITIDGNFKPISKFGNFKIRKLNKEYTTQ